MFGFGRRRRQERDEFLLVHSKIAAIHGDLLRRDEELIDALTDLTRATDRVGERLRSETSVLETLHRMIEGREQPAIDLTKERVLGGSVSVDEDLPNNSTFVSRRIY